MLDLLFARAVPCSFNTAGPGYLAYIPGGGLFHAAVARLLADTVNRYIGVFAAAPALSQLEADVVRWLAGVVGFPASARGMLTSGGSLANFTAVVTAGERLPEGFAGTLYVSDQTHHSVGGGPRGFPAAAVRAVPSDARCGSLDALAAMVAADRAAGRQPFLVVGNGGPRTPARSIRSPSWPTCGREGLWFHVDAAYGGFFALTERGRATLAGMERADSVILDPHRMFLP